jgi:hypothetical protein
VAPGLPSGSTSSRLGVRAGLKDIIDDFDNDELDVLYKMGCFSPAFSEVRDVEPPRCSSPTDQMEACEREDGEDLSSHACPPDLSTPNLKKRQNCSKQSNQPFLSSDSSDYESKMTGSHKADRKKVSVKNPSKSPRRSGSKR